MSVCTSAEIAEKRRIAMAKLQAKKAQVQSSKSSTNSATSAKEQLSAKTAASKFYNSPPQNNNAKPVAMSDTSSSKSSSFLNALKAIKATSSRELSRASAHPYQRPNNAVSKPILSLSPEKQNPAAALAPVFVKSITCRIYLISPRRFAVEPSSYHEKLIDVFKKMPTKSYDNQTRIWSFDLKDYQAIQQHVGDLKPHVLIGTIPKKIMEMCQQTPKPLERSVLASINPTLSEKLMPFQQEGVWWV